MKINVMPLSVHNKWKWRLGIEKSLKIVSHMMQIAFSLVF
jgi:hypothetical protein